MTVACGLALVVGGGFWQGRLIGRWDPLPVAPAVSLSSIPKEFGEWTGTDFELPESDIKVASIDRYLARVYEHRVSGDIITVMIVSGPGGPISVHPPEACFGGRGYEHDVVVPIKVPSQDPEKEHEFFTAIFRGPDSTDGQRLQMFWAWFDSRLCSAPANPRLAFARRPRLYKIYVQRPLLPNQGREDTKDCVEFMKLFLPALERLMDGSGEPSESAQPTEIPGETALPAADGDVSAPVQEPPLKKTMLELESSRRPLPAGVRRLSDEAHTSALVAASPPPVQGTGRRIASMLPSLSPVHDGDDRS